MIGVVADDLTGANDIGVMFAKNDYLTHVYSLYDDVSKLDRDVDVLILNTNSRLDAPEFAYKKVREATEVLVELGCTMFYNKTCSVFRGNIGSEFDAMLDLLDEEFCPVILGFPRTGRTTRAGIHYVNGVLLEESPFRHDPANPMTESDLVSILQKQTGRQVGLISHELVHQGVDAIKEALDDLRDKYQYVILDVLTQEDLHTIAGAVKDQKVLAGSSAIAEELPKWLDTPGKGYGKYLQRVTGSQTGSLIMGGSVTPQTRAQVKAAKEAGYTSYVLDGTALLDAEERNRVIESLTEEVSAHIAAGVDVLVHSQNEPEEVAAAKEAGARQGLGDREVGRLISGTLASIAKRVVDQTGLSRLIILGGETAGAISDSLGIIGNVVLEEIDPGVPSGLALGDVNLLLVLKSGSFGSEDFVIRADRHVKALSQGEAVR